MDLGILVDVYMLLELLQRVLRAVGEGVEARVHVIGRTCPLESMLLEGKALYAEKRWSGLESIFGRLAESERASE